MKKSKLSITLVTSFIAAMALTACNEVTASKEALVTFTPYGSKEAISLITDDVYQAYRGTSSGVTKFYDKILEVLIRYQFKENNFDKGELKYSEIESWAKNQVQEQKDKAKANAKSNGTKYDDEWKSILDSNNVDDAEGLKQKFIYDKEKEVITNWYADNTDNAEALKNEFLGIDANGQKVDSKVKAAMPYHIRHILVKVDEAGNAQEKFYKGTISEAQAKLLADTVSTLASGKYTFSQVASMYSEDGSASSGGDVGIMTNAATSGSLGMVNEFQLGLYAYDNLYDATNAADGAAAAIKEGLGITDDVKAALPANAVEVPYEAFVKIGEAAKVTADKEGNKLANGSTAVYPRNILWNKYLNLHNVFVIKNAKVGANKFGATDAADEFDNLCGSGEYDAGLKNFNADGYLCDESGNVIIGVRSQYGIHFMIIEKSMYDYAELATYYSTKLPGDEGYSADSYVGYIVSQSKEDYKKRADDVKSKITSFDSTYDYRLYQYLNTQVTVKFSGAAEGLGEEIDAYIEKTQENNSFKQEDGLNKVWRTYTELLGAQEADRDRMFDTVNAQGDTQSNLTRLVSEAVADDFMKLYEGLGDTTTYAKFAEGGLYYYYA
jgi:hypothetical protein